MELQPWKPQPFIPSCDTNHPEHCYGSGKSHESKEHPKASSLLQSTMSSTWFYNEEVNGASSELSLRRYSANQINVCSRWAGFLSSSPLSATCQHWDLGPGSGADSSPRHLVTLVILRSRGAALDGPSSSPSCGSAVQWSTETSELPTQLSQQPGSVWCAHIHIYQRGPAEI